MADISSELAEAGMIVSENVVTNRNMMIIPAGTTLTEKHLGLLKTWGVSKVTVEGDDPSSPLASMTDEEKESLKAELQKRFQHVDLKAEQVKYVYNLALAQLAEVWTV